MEIYKKDRYISVFLWIAAFFAIWELAALILDKVAADPLAYRKLPYFHQVAVELCRYSGDLAEQGVVTMKYACQGFLWGCAAGILLSLLMDMSGILKKTLMPYVTASQMIPILGLAPVVFGLIKDIENVRIVIAAYMTFFPVVISLTRGMRSVDEDSRALMRLYAAGRKTEYIKLILPHSIPWLFTGLKMAAPMAVTASVLVDTLSARDGIGYVLVLTLYGGGTTGEFWPAVLTASLMGVLSFAAVSIIEYIIDRWRYRRRTGKKEISKGNYRRRVIADEQDKA